MKPGRLTEDERIAIQKHCEIGERILREPSLIEICSEGELSQLPSTSPESDALLELARQIALSHHERWDGKGYPFGLSGTEIPLCARIVCVADVYDALTSARPYKAALPHDEAIRIIEHNRGTQFDPDVVDALLRVESEVADVRRSVAAAQSRMETASDATLADLKALWANSNEVNPSCQPPIRS